MTDNNDKPGHLARRFQQIAVAIFHAEVEEAGLRGEWERVLEASAAMEQELCAAGFEQAAQYAVSMAYKIRFVMQMTAREAMHLTELRSQQHP